MSHESPRYPRRSGHPRPSGWGAVNSTHAPRFSDFARRHYGEGLAEDEAIGERNTIRMVLKARRLTLTQDQGKLIDDCDDLSQLKKWAEAALTAEKTSDIFL